MANSSAHANGQLSIAMNVTDERDWAARTAMRLHIWQESLAADAPESRGPAIWEYIAGALAELGDVDERFRINSLRALDEEFPFYEERKILETAPTTSAVQSPELPRIPPTPSECLQALIESSKTLKEEERQEFAQRLCNAGFQVAEPLSSRAVPARTGEKQPLEKKSAMPIVVPEYQEELGRLIKTVEKIQSTLGFTYFKPGAALNLIRSLQMLGLMSEQFLLLHPQIWGMWEKIVTNHQYTTSFHKPILEPDESLAKFLQGLTSAKRTDVAQVVTKTFYLASALVSAVEMAGKEFAAWFFEKFGPQNIESVVQYEANGSQTGTGEYWQRYRQLADAHSIEELAEQFNNLLGRNMIRHIQRGPGT